MAFCDNLRELLEDRGVTQKRLAQDLKVAASTIGGYVQGTSEPDFDMLKRIARYFDVSADFLLDIHSSKADTHSEDVLLEVFKAAGDISGAGKSGRSRFEGRLHGQRTALKRLRLLRKRFSPEPFLDSAS